MITSGIYTQFPAFGRNGSLIFILKYKENAVTGYYCQRIFFVYSPQIINLRIQLNNIQ